ncbi:MAG: single-stranded DNA-binding protein [Odoribacteraceae bacterium]|jgi:single-strand DNA-binding protein|nr:single-stranded DNA-binding protein [Odoribacteraceae bacterium]
MINKVILIGNVGADPTIRYLEGGTPVANLRLATTEIYKNKTGDRIEQTEWHNIVLWRVLAQVVESHVKKGTQLYIEGKLRNRSWEDQNKVIHNITEIYADTMQVLARRKENTENAPAGSPSPTGPREKRDVPASPRAPLPTPDATAVEDPDDLPF